MKAIVLIVDGLGDLPVPALGGRTPLEAAETPNLDRLAAAGRYGVIDPVGPGIVPNTDSGSGILLGLYPGQAERLSRGPVEAAGLGFELLPGDVALRANFASVQPTAEGLVLRDRRAGRIEAGAPVLSALFEKVDLGDQVSASLTSTEQHRGVLVLTGPGLDVSISDTDPGDRAVPCILPECEALADEARFTADKVNRFAALAHERLREHPVNVERAGRGLPPANAIITRGAGLAPELENLVYDSGLQASVISGCNTVCGLGRLFGFDIITDDSFTAALDTDLEAKVAAAVAALPAHDLVYVHVKAPDICAHDRRPLAKRDFLQRMDRALAPLLDAGALIAVAADHTTDSNTGLHTADPVPALIAPPNPVRSRNDVEFGESACRSGNLPRQGSHEFLGKLIARLTGA